MAELESEYQAMLREELRAKRRLLHEREMQLAKAGIFADPAITIARDDLRKEVAAIEAKLGIAWPAPAPERSRYTPTPRAAYDFEAEQAQRRQGERQRDIAHQTNLLSIHRRNLALLRSQARQLGAHAPFHVQAQMTDAKAEIATIKATLRSFYGQAVDDLPGDE